MGFYNIYFSPTGGTKAVAEAVTEGFGEKFISVDMIKQKEEAEKLEFSPEDFVFISVPSFGGRVPSCAVDILKKISGGRSRAAAGAVFGNRAIDDTLTELSDVLESRGFDVKCGFEAVAEHSLIRDFAKGRPDSEDKAELHLFGEKIREAYINNSFPDEVVFPGSHSYKKYNGVPMKPYTGDSCIECGLCAKECPAGAIPFDNYKYTDKDMCISCMHCVAVCPEHSRRISHVMVSVAAVAMKKACSGRKENKLYLR